MAESTTIFIWEGVDKKGVRVKGETSATSENLAKAELRRQGINPLKIRKKPKPLFGGRKKITPKDVAVFLRQMSTMMSAGVPLVQAFEIVGRGHENPSMQELIIRIKSDVEGGSTFASALRRHPLQFDDLVVNLVSAGEQSGALETLLNRIATYKEKTESLKAKIKKAMFYPAAVIVVAFIVTAILLIFVVPQFQDLFRGFGADLPVFTRFVIGISEFFQAYWWAIFGGIALAAVAFTQARKRSAGFRRQLDLLSLRIPVVGELLRKAAIARFARTLATMFSAGVPLVEAMQSVAGATGNALYYEATMRMRDATAGGTQLQQAMRDTSVFPNMVVQMVAIGEESGSLDEMLGKVADFYEEEVDNMVDALSSLMEPMIMAFLGIVVGGLVIAMYLPIFQLGSVV
ncbi:type II secretion system F family protein [Ectothiorhodospira mobilis]|uniref:type II secretion system F family protein n=1 Tax=Ectothiorhodospira mobilis TaxID=195064 RepID=UPI0019082EFA|nr:type II secretion system F family protein [Ectothiorhodospira mobilis]MBK1691302.1 type II secretion system protein F [Ectothiorhodospira mobilis]